MSTDPTTLHELVLAATTDAGRSINEAVLKARAAGRKITVPHIYKWAEGATEPLPRPEVVRTLAWLAGFPDEVAFRAAGVWEPGVPADPANIRSLRDLAEAAVGYSGVSVRKMCEDAAEQGIRLSYTIVNNIRAGKYDDRTRPETVKALAWMAGINEEAALEALDVQEPAPRRVDPDSITSLSALVDAALDYRGSRSVRQMCQEADRQGFELAYTTVNHIRAGTYKATPQRKTLKALAWLADVPDEVAFRAAGLQAPGPPLADELPPDADRLSPQSRRIVIDMVRRLLALESDNAV
ncbi:hypothetical protein LG293_17980 (plasmid) [Citricoccus nitrophenolicus]